MTEYLLLIHDNASSATSADEWEAFLTAAKQSGLFRGGSEIGSGTLIGSTSSVGCANHLVGYMRFDTDDRDRLVELLESHPVVKAGGTVELRELPKS